MKGLLKILVVLALIAALAVWALWQQSRPDSASQSLPTWASFDQSTAEDILIQSPGTTAIHLQRQHDTWMLLPAGDEAPVKADAEAVGHLLTDLANMRIVRVVSHQPEHFSRLQVDEKGAVHVTIKDTDGKALLDIFVGKPASDLISTYVRRRGENAAVTVNRSLTWQVKRVRSGWQAPKPAPAATPPAPLKPGPLKDAYSQS